MLGFSCLLQGELKESFSYQERIQLLKMATFGINAELLQDVNTTNTENTASKEIAWLEGQLNSPSAYDNLDDDWLTHFQRLEELSMSSMPTTDFYNVNVEWDTYNIFNRSTADWVRRPCLMVY